MDGTIFLSTAYLPPIEYIINIVFAKKIVIEQYETFPKQTYRNRCLICSSSGILPLSIPIVKPYGNRSRTNEVEISYKSDWVLNHWRAIESAYNNSAYFLFYKDELWKILNKRHNNLLELNMELLEYVLRILKINREIELSTDFLVPKDEKNDFRFIFTPKKQKSIIELSPYYQVFSNKSGFIPNLSIIDLLFNKGPEAHFYIESAVRKIIP